MTNMKNIFGVLSDAFCNSGNALLSLIPILTKIVNKDQIINYKNFLQEERCSIFSEKTKKEFNHFFSQFINNMYQISSLIVFLINHI